MNRIDSNRLKFSAQNILCPMTGSNVLGKEMDPVIEEESSLAIGLDSQTKTKGQV